MPRWSARSPLNSLRAQAANLVTLTRILLLFVVVALAFAPSFAPRASAALLAALVLALDAADGAIARRLGCASRVGAVLDIVGDRLVEIVWWMTLAVLGAVPVLVPLVVVTRGIVVDAVRSLALARGFTAFGETSMMRSRLGKALVSSRLSRGLYGAAKALAFPILFLLHASRAAGTGALAAAVDVLRPVAPILVALVVVFCVVRALPVVVESRRFLLDPPGAPRLPA